MTLPIMEAVRFKVAASTPYPPSFEQGALILHGQSGGLFGAVEPGLEFHKGAVAVNPALLGLFLHGVGLPYSLRAKALS
ncbi:MAG: hypothetical protein HYR94_19025 [Chloroflexi bacterium]|nr:hypothetical protein [Chloroflexota bacterium]